MQTIVMISGTISRWVPPPGAVVGSTMVTLLPHGLGGRTAGIGGVRTAVTTPRSTSLSGMASPRA
eukprot:9996133-Alexandrium_andersonii.AAC.1